MKLKAVVAALCGLYFVLPPNVSAQPPENVRMRIGPMFVNPTIALTNAGVDTNVFNESTQQSPKEDFTLTVTPATDLWLRMGRTWLTGSVHEDLVYYQKYDTERSANSLYKLGWLIPLTRVSFNPTISYANTRERPGFEVDTRARRNELTVGGTIEIRALSKTFIALHAERLASQFDGSAEFLGISLRDQLNRTVTTETVGVRHELTPLTSVTVDVAREQDRFEFSPLRDSDSTRIFGGVKFDPAALIKGGAAVGYRDFQPLDPSLPRFRGATLSTDLSYVLLGVTKFAVKAGRDVQYSYDINQPYYVQTGVNVEVTQRIFGPVDAVGRAGSARLEYRDRAGTAVAVSDRVDHIEIYGGGLGYHIGRDMRIGFNIDQNKRLSPVTGRQYEGLRYGVAVTYGS